MGLTHTSSWPLFTQKDKPVGSKCRCALLHNMSLQHLHIYGVAAVYVERSQIVFRVCWLHIPKDAKELPGTYTLIWFSLVAIHLDKLLPSPLCQVRRAGGLAPQ